jgi:hypothetical protein
MKFHLDIDNSGKAACGAVANRPDTFVYNEKGFTSHLATEYRCKKCQEILEQTKSKSNMKYTLQVKETKNKAGKFEYTVTDENGKYVCSRKSNRTYVAVLISTNGGAYAWFGREDLIGKGDSRHWINAPDARVVRLIK